MFANDSVTKVQWLKSEGKKWSKHKPENTEINQIYTVKHFFWI